MLEPLEQFEAIRRRAMRLGDRLADLAYANPYRGVQEQARAVLREALAEERLLDLQYTPFGGHTLTRRAVADSLRESHGLDFAFDDVIMTPGAMSALQLALRACGEPGDEVIVPVPCWLDHPLYVRFTDRVPVLVDLAGDEFDLDVDAIAAALTERTAAVLFSHPANPTGRSYPESALRDLAQALREGERRSGREIALIADETHRDFTRAGAYRSAASQFDRTLVAYSFGKYHFMQGQRLGYVAVSPRHPERVRIASELVAWTRITATVTPTSLMQRAVPRLLELEHDLSWLERWRERMVGELEAAGYSVTRPEATLFVYVRTPGDGDDFAFATELARSGVLVMPAQVFHHSGHFRLSLTGSDEMLERALPTLARHASR